jgi:hypothetical protein
MPLALILKDFLQLFSMSGVNGFETSNLGSLVECSSHYNIAADLDYLRLFGNFLPVSMADGFKTSNTDILVDCYINFNTVADNGYHKWLCWWGNAKDLDCLAFSTS